MRGASWIAVLLACAFLAGCTAAPEASTNGGGKSHTGGEAPSGVQSGVDAVLPPVVTLDGALAHLTWRVGAAGASSYVEHGQDGRFPDATVARSGAGVFHEQVDVVPATNASFRVVLVDGFGVHRSAPVTLAVPEQRDLAAPEPTGALDPFGAPRPTGGATAAKQGGSGTVAQPPALTDTPVPPGAPSGLAARIQGSRAVVRLTAPPADTGFASSGPATSYELHVASGQLPPQPSGPQLPAGVRALVPTPGLPGEAQEVTLEGLTGATVHWIAIRAVDHEGLKSAWSPLGFVVEDPANPTDTRAPGDLGAIQSAGAGMVALAFPAPADDGHLHSSGPVVAYEHHVVAGTAFPPPFAAGVAPSGIQVTVGRIALPGQIQSAAVTGLPDGPHWIALRALDEAGNRGPPAYALVGLPAPDTTAPGGPGPVTCDATATSLTVRFAAPGDDGAAGAAVTGYEQDVQLLAGAQPAFSAGRMPAGATAAYGTLAAPGALQSLTLGSLTAATSYQVAVRALDDVGNQGAVRTATCATLGTGDTVPPAAPAAISAVATSSSALITFTAPGDDGTGGGSVAAYQVHASAGLAVPDPFVAGTAPAGVAVTVGPLAAPGASQQVTLTGLAPSQQYRVLVRAVDEVGNAGPTALASFATSAALPMSVTSTEYPDGGVIPDDYSCFMPAGSMPFRVTNLPAGTTDIAWVMDDPDAFGYVHWTAWDLDPADTDYPAGFDPADAGGLEGKNDAGWNGYLGPCPPPGVHRYNLRVYALSEPVGLASGVAGPAVQSRLAALDGAGKVLGEATLMGHFGYPHEVQITGASCSADNLNFYNFAATAGRPARYYVENNGACGHHWAIDGTSYDVGPLPPGGSGLGDHLTLPSGSYDLKCLIHPVMAGTLNLT